MSLARRPGVEMTLFKNRYRIQSSRLVGWDYASEGWYFVTICTRQCSKVFGHTIDGEMHPTPLGKIASQFWAEIPQHSPLGTEIDAYVVMPNHIHGIIIIDRDVPGRDVACNVSTDDSMAQISPKSGSLSAIVRSYKSAVKRWARANGYSSFDWQERFYDHIIRSENALEQICDYILSNPAKWETDRNHRLDLWM